MPRVTIPRRLRIKLPMIGQRFVQGAVLTLMLLAVVPAHAASPEQQMQQMRSLVEILTGYYKLMEEIRAVAADSDQTAVLQMAKLKDYLDQSGQHERLVRDLRELSTSSSSLVVRNAATIMLTDALSEQGNKSEAAEILERALRVTPEGK